MVFFSFFRRVRERYPPLLSSSSSSSSSSSLSSSSSSSGFRDESTKGPRPKPNETKHGSLLFAPPPPTRSVVHAHAHTWTHICTRVCTRVRVYVYVNASTRIPSRSYPRFFASFAPVPPSRTPFFLPSRFILRQQPGEVCRRPLLILSRRSTASPAVSLALLPCRFCVSYPLHARRPSHSFALRALSLEQPINSVGRRQVRTTILSLSSHRPTVLTPI